MVDRKVLFHILLHPFLFLKMRNRIQAIGFKTSYPVRFLLYSERDSIERLAFKPGDFVLVWRTWRKGIHYIGICFGSKLVRKTLIHGVLHEIGHVICYETRHESHQIAPKLSKEVHEAIKEREISYREANKELLAAFSPLRKIEYKCKGIDLVDIFKEFYADDMIIKYGDPKERLEELTREAEDLCRISSPKDEMPPSTHPFAKILFVFLQNPLMFLTPVLVSVWSEALAARVSKKATYLRREFEQSQSRLDKLYKRFPIEVSELRERLVPFFSDLRENPSPSDFVEYLHELRDRIVTFYDSYTWWLQQVKNATGNLSLTT